MQQKNKALAIGMIAFMVMSAIGILEVGEVRGETKNGYTQHEPIYINGNENFTEENGVVSGNGTKENPYVIEGWNINASSKIGIDIENTDVYFVIRNCYVHDGYKYDENFYNDYDGIYFYNIKNGKIENCVIKNDFDGISLYYSSNNNISGNNISNNDYAGISLIYSSNNNISGNNISNNDYGIHLQNSSNNNISSNNISNNNDGIYLFSSSNNNNINSNNIFSNDYDGVSLFSSSNNNKIYLNNIMNNRNQAYDNSSNRWDYNSKGNYWSDYKGEDKNKDGIGDTPYLISGGNNKDNYPLMQPVNNFTVPNNQKTQTTSTIPNSTIILYAISIIAILSLSGVVVRFFRRNRNS